MKGSRTYLGPALTVFFVLLGCKPHAPARPAGVPVSAVWVGGADGGAFIDCARSLHGEPNRCNVYNDGTGAVEMDGLFVVRGQARGARADELQYDSADGTRIYLKNNLVLVPYGAVESNSAHKK